MDSNRDQEELERVFEQFNQIRTTSGEYAEHEFVKWFNDNCSEDNYFRNVKRSVSLYYDLDIETVDGWLLKIEMKTKKKGRDIKLFQALYPSDIINLFSDDRKQFALDRFSLFLENNKFDYLVALFGNQTEVFNVDYFKQQISNFHIKEEYTIWLNIVKPIVMKECVICGSIFSTNKDNVDICNKVNCKKEKLKLMRVDDSVRKHARRHGYIVCYPGRFEPFCRHHYKVYKELVKKFGAVNIVTTDNVDYNSPAPYAWKYETISKYGINHSRIRKAIDPYSSKELFTNLKLDDNSISFIVAVGRKDKNRLLAEGKKKDGSDYYFTQYLDTIDLKPANEKGYVLLVDNVTDSANEISSASTLRKTIVNSKVKKEEKINLWKTMTALDENDFQIFQRSIMERQDGCSSRAHKTSI